MASSCRTFGWLANWKLTTTGTSGSDGVFTNLKEIVAYSIPPTGPGQPSGVGIFVEDGKVSGDGVFTQDQAPFGRDSKSVTLSFTVTWHEGDNTSTALLH